MTFADAFQKSLDTGCVIRLAGDPWLWRAGSGFHLVSVDRVGVKDGMTTFAALSEWEIVEVPDFEARLVALDEERKSQKTFWLDGVKYASETLAKIAKGYRAYKKDPQSDADHMTEWHMGRAQGMADAQQVISELIEKESMPSIQLAK